MQNNQSSPLLSRSLSPSSFGSNEVKSVNERFVEALNVVPSIPKLLAPPQSTPPPPNATSTDLPTPPPPWRKCLRGSITALQLAPVLQVSRGDGPPWQIIYLHLPENQIRFRYSSRIEVAHISMEGFTSNGVKSEKRRFAEIWSCKKNTEILNSDSLVTNAASDGMRCTYREQFMCANTEIGEMDKFPYSISSPATGREHQSNFKELQDWLGQHSGFETKSFCRGWMQRKELLLQKDATIKIQSAFCCMNCRQSFTSQRHAAIDIQRFIRGQATRRKLLGAFCSRTSTKCSYQGLELRILLQSILKLQRWWQHVLQDNIKSKCAVVVQSHVRGWMARQKANKEKQRAVVIQSYWKGYLARKDARGQLLELRLRMQKSAANVDDSRRLINRLVSAVSELLNMRSASGIPHTCATLDVTTELSEKCCEELVAAGAIGTLQKLIRSVSRSIPDQQVLKHALSTLRNLAHYPSLAHVLVESHGCVETVLLEFVRDLEIVLVTGNSICSNDIQQMTVHGWAADY